MLLVGAFSSCSRLIKGVDEGKEVAEGLGAG